MKRRQLHPDMPAEEIFEITTEGSEVAAYYIVEIMTKNSGGMAIFLDMDDMNIRGDQITYAIRTICNGDIKAFVDLVRARSQYLVDELNKEFSHKAVQHGASFKDRSK